MNQKKREEKNGIWLKRLGPIGLCQVQEVEELQKELSEAECKIKLLQSEQEELQGKNRKAHEVSTDKIKRLLLQAKETDFEKLESIMLSVLKAYPQFDTPVPFKMLKDFGDETINRGVCMGEGWLLTAEMAELIDKGYNNIVCVQPFGCLPNHIVGKGMIRKLREQYPEANICAIDYDAGATKVNQENRIKLMLSLANEGLSS